MKKFYLSLATFGLFLNNLQAQETIQAKPNRWRVGIIAGLNRSTVLLTSYQPVSFSPHSDFLAGLDLYFRLSQRSSLHGQPSWTSSSHEELIINYSDIPSFNISTVKLPILYHYRILSTKIAPFVEAGIAYNRATNSRYTVRLPSICDPGPCPVNTYSGVNFSLTNKSALSAIGSIGIDINLKMVSIPVALRYERYMSDYTFSTGWFRSSPQLRFENIALLTGINF